VFFSTIDQRQKEEERGQRKEAQTGAQVIKKQITAFCSVEKLLSYFLA
jgi:cell division protein FtsL